MVAHQMETEDWPVILWGNTDEFSDLIGDL